MKRLLIVLVCALAVTAATARADVIVRDDGQRFEGEILAETPEAVSIDTVIATIRTTLRIPRSQVKSMEKAPVPAGFFEPPPAPARVSDPKTFGAQDTLFLEVPVVGTFGEGLYADGIGKVLAYAKRNRVRHLVFFIDSTGWNDIDEAGDVVRLLKQYHEGMTYHAIIRTCIGDALAVALMCDTVTLVPGAKIGGAPGNLTDASKKQAAQDEEVLRQQIAADVVNHLHERGRPGTVVRAMIDPVDALAVWRDDQGRPEFGAEPPKDLPADRLIFTKAPGEILVLSYDQLVKLGLPAFEGGAANLGKVMNLPDWKLESEYGRKALADILAAKKKATQFEFSVRSNISRREVVDRAMKNDLRMAAQYDPSKGAYQMQGAGAVSSSWNWRGNEEYHVSAGSNYFTLESQKRWQILTDTSLMYLQRAAQAVLAMTRLDQEAARLGLEPTYKPGELNVMAQNMNTQYNLLKAERNKKGN